MTCYEKFGATGLINEEVLKRIGALFNQRTKNYVLEIYPVEIRLKRFQKTRWKAYIASDLYIGGDVRTADVITFLDLDEILTNYFNVSLYTLTNDIVIRILGFRVIELDTYIWKGEFGTEIKLIETPSSDAKYSCTISSFGNVKKRGGVSTLKELDAMLVENDLDGIF